MRQDENPFFSISMCHIVTSPPLALCIESCLWYLRFGKTLVAMLVSRWPSMWKELNILQHRVLNFEVAKKTPPEFPGDPSGTAFSSSSSSEPQNPPRRVEFFIAEQRQKTTGTHGTHLHHLWQRHSEHLRLSLSPIKE